jgi:hypothetical protein
VKSALAVKSNPWIFYCYILFCCRVDGGGRVRDEAVQKGLSRMEFVIVLNCSVLE